MLLFLMCQSEWKKLTTIYDQNLTAETTLPGFKNGVILRALYPGSASFYTGLPKNAVNSSILNIWVKPNHTRRSRDSATRKGLKNTGLRARVCNI